MGFYLNKVYINLKARLINFEMKLLALILSVTLLPAALCQFDGNPHNWDRRRRCDRFDYDPPCTVCEGYGGIPYGDENDEITLTTCKPIASEFEIDPETLVRPVWGETWTLPEAREILIGPKTDPIYPVNDLWVDKLQYVGREIIGVEYLKDEGLEEYELDHWAFGPHHAWTFPDSGRILRMWQPFNGLQVYPGTSVDPSYVDPEVFKPIPPTECIKGRNSAWFRTGCEDDGFPTIVEIEQRTKFNHKVETKVVEKDIWRAKTKVPRHDYKGMGFTDMSLVLNQWINSSYSAVPCHMWKVEELQQLQALLWLAKESSFDEIYQATQDNRRMRDEILSDIQKTWKELNDLAANSEDPNSTNIRRDGHCHEAVMWFVHHLTEDMKQLLHGAEIKIPLLSHYRHDCDDTDDSDRAKVCRSYKTQVTCQDCHSDL